MQTTFRTVLLAAALSAFGAVADAQQNAPVQSTMQGFVVELDRDGNELLLPAERVEPRQTIEWQVTYSNVTANPQNNLVVTVPVPAGTTYLAETARADTPTTLLVSIDNGQSFAAPPITRQRRAANGAMVTETVPASDYTNVRWQASEPLRGFDAQNFYYRVIVD